jgi:hypothetical protein
MMMSKVVVSMDVSLGSARENSAYCSAFRRDLYAGNGWCRWTVMACEAIGSPVMKQDVFERLKHAQIGEPIHQPLIFAILVILISITLYFIRT